MRILALVSDAFGGQGGIAKFNRDLLSALCRDADVERVVAIPRLISEAPGKLPEKLEFITSGVGGKLCFAWVALKTAIANRESRIIICGHINLLPIAFLAKLICRAPIVLVIHGIDAWQPSRNWFVNRLVGKADAVVAVSEFTRKKFWAWAQPGRARHFILPNCVDITEFTPGEKNPALLQRYGLQGKTVLLTVARLSASERYKGLDEVLEVLPELARTIPNIAYLIVGDGTDRARLEQKVTQLGLQGRVVFAGRIAEGEKVDHYRLADAFVMPGRGEGFGIVYLEALACGVPVMASKVDASEEVVRECRHAVAVNPANVEEIRAGIETVLKMPVGFVAEQVQGYSRQNFERRCSETIRALVTICD